MTYKEKAEAYVREKCGLKIPDALPLPVKYDGINFYWGGEESGMVADIVPDYDGGEFLRIRGWGRIHHLKVEGKTPEQLQNDVAFWIADAINAYSKLQLQHYLQVLDKQAKLYQLNNAGVLFWNINQDGIAAKIMHFDLKTGEPEGEAGFKDFCEIVGV